MVGSRQFTNHTNVVEIHISLLAYDKKDMSRSALSAKVFSIYLIIVGTILIFIPNFLLSIFLIPTISEVWIRVLGLTVVMLGVYASVAAKHEHVPFLEASIYTRFVVFMAFVGFAVLGLASPMIVLFGVADLAGGMWTYFALKADRMRHEPQSKINKQRRTTFVDDFKER